MKKIIFILLTLVYILDASSYYVKYHGMKLGKIDDISTIDKLYLKAKVTSKIARFMLGKDYLVYFSGNKPNIKDVKFKKDKKMILYAFKTSIKEKPKFKRFKINDIKNITLECKSDKACHFTYYKNDKINGYGDIVFDKDGEFVSITEKKSNFKIERVE